jgi:hypothetical protein
MTEQSLRFITVLTSGISSGNDLHAEDDDG